MDPRAIQALAGRGIPADGEHHVTRLDTGNACEADLLVVLDHSHANRLHELGTSFDRMVRLRAFDPGPGPPAAVADPFEADQGAYEQTLTRIQRCIPGLVTEIRTRLPKVTG